MAKSPATSKSKTTAAKKPGAKSAVKATAQKAAPKPLVVRETTPVVADPALKKKELIDTVVERSGIKKKDAKPVVEAMLAVLGQAIAEGRELNLQPFGKLKINRSKEVQGGSVIVAKIRQSNAVATPPRDPVAKAAE